MSKPQQIDLGNLNNNNLGIVYVISPGANQGCMQMAVDNGGDLAKYGYFGEVPVSVIVAVKKVVNNEDCLVITDLAVLEAYALHFNVETTLIKHILDLLPKKHLKRCYLATKDPKLMDSSILSDFGFSPVEMSIEGVQKDCSVYVT